MIAAKKLVDTVARLRRDHESTILYTASSVAKAGMGFVATFVTMRAVAPADLGLWNSLTLATTYSAFLQAGVNNGLNRELPYALGRGDDEGARRLAGTAQAFTALSCLIALAGGLFALVYFRDRGTAFVAAIAVETIAVLCFLYQGYLVVTFRSTTSFKALAKVEFIGVAAGLAGLPLVLWWSFPGMLWRIAATSVLGIALLHVARPMRARLHWDRDELATLMKTGVPIFALYYIESSFSTVDRLLLLQKAGVETVGYYSLSLMVQQAMMVVPMSLAVYMYPRMTYHWGKDHDRAALWSRAWKSTLAAALVMLPVVVIGYLALPWLVHTFFPRYAPGIDAARITLIGSLFNGSAIGTNALWSMTAWKYMASYQLCSAALRAIGPWIGISVYPDSLIGVAAGTAVACLLQFLVGTALTFYATTVARDSGADAA